ncbi:hypothetical protein [Paenibacillus terrae]|uniref:Uncharacterized protein n=1 Tax=Paenibacillus terrae TaxID=159743 RepID=A0A0D7WVE0_9BACL|nr:hypothetical protein [Paenibacillus terrae]KJD42944.1 hypothetical protein QD47_25335 [Paenibacillus terrae]
MNIQNEMLEMNNKIAFVEGPFNQLWRSTSELFKSLPRTDQAQMIIDALNGDSILLREHSYEKNRLYADLYINDEKLTFITLGSKRMIVIEKNKDNIFMTIEFGGNGSSIAAKQIMRAANRYNPNNTVLFYTVDQQKHHAKELG